MSKGFLITGTDTGVGKTIIAGALIKVLNYIGLKTGAMKPVESGCGTEADALVPYDGMFLKEIAHINDHISVITPCCFISPLAPLPASEIENTEVDIAEIKRSFKRLSVKYEAVVVEGLGGLMVPIKKDYNMADLSLEFGLPLLVVARPGLGTINHTMLTVNYALNKGLTVAGIILNYSQPPENSLSEKTNPKLLAQISPVPVIGIFPYMKNLNEDMIAQKALKNLDIEEIKKYLL